MNTPGVLTGIVVAEHHEPYGDFSVEPPAFAAQFTKKSIRDPFKIGDDEPLPVPQSLDPCSWGSAERFSRSGINPSGGFSNAYQDLAVGDLRIIEGPTAAGQERRHNQG